MYEFLKSKWGIGLWKLGTGIILFLNISCSGGLAEMNIDPNKASDLSFGAQLLGVQRNISGEGYENSRALLTLCSPYIQHNASIRNSNEFSGGKYEYIEIVTSALWEKKYPAAIKNIVDLVERTKGNTENVNFNAIARIVKVLAFQRLTDLYGDIPYLEAGRGFLNEIPKPKFDTQKFIYLDLLNELEVAAQLLDSNKLSYGSSDMYYDGNIDKWKKFAYSLMLRLGMRLSEVDSVKSEYWVKRAINYGGFTSNSDMAYSKHYDDSPNGISSALSSNNFYKLSATLVNWLRDTNDPRLDIYGFVREGGGPQKGLPNETDATTIKNLPLPNEIETFSTYNTKLVRLNAPLILMSYAEVELLTAEAIIRGWVPGDAELHYNMGVYAGMTQWSIFGEDIEIPDRDSVNNYLEENSFNPQTGMEQIARQYWLVTFLNEYESYANWRRINLPVLIPVVHDISDSPGVIPTRFPYPTQSYSLNKVNTLEAVSRLGMMDNINSKVWWDK